MINRAALAQQSIALLRRAGIMPVLTVATVEQGVATARALQAGGLTAVEVTLRSAVALEAIRAIRDALPEFVVGVGTVIELPQIAAAVNAGAQFIVTPGTPSVMADALVNVDLPIIPGAATPSEILELARRGFTAQKLFPATAVGGLPLLRAIAAPIPSVVFCPTGGISEANAAEFLREPNVVCVGGSWMVKREWIAQGDYASVTAAAAQCHALLQARGG